MPQLVQDVLIGTKIYSVAVNEANQVVNKEKTIKEAAIDTLKDWGIKEARGIVFLTTPMVRYLTGLINDRDPYDKMPIYPIDPKRLPTTTKLYYEAIYLGKVFIPYLSQYLGEEALGKPADLVKKEVLDKLVGMGALGIYDITPKAQIKYFDEVSGKEKILDWDDYNKIKDLANRETLILVKIEDDWVNSGLMPEEFIKTKEFENSILEIKKLWVKYNPKTEKLSIEDIALALDTRLANSLGEDITSVQRWLNTQLQRAKTDEEKKKWREKYEEIKKLKLIDSIKTLSKTAREIYLEAK